MLEARCSGRLTLLEREGELAALDAALDALAADGMGATILVIGEPGCGKTTLLDAIRHAAVARPPTRVLHGRATEIEAQLPFGLLRQLLEPPLERLDEAERSRVLDGAASPAGTLLGALDATVPHTVPAIAHGAYWAIARLADDAPLCLVVDDLQWADPPSLEALAYVARRASEHPILIVAATREDGVDDDRGDARHSLEHEADAVLRPAALGDAACGALGQRMLAQAPTPAFRTACARATGGNPWLLEELFAACRAADVRPDDDGAERIASLVPQVVGRSVLQRLTGSGDDAIALARAVAVLETARIADAARLAGLDAASATRAADALGSSGILRPSLPLEFVHPLARAVVQAELSAPARSQMHRDAARILAPHRLETAAAHLLRGEPGSDRWAIDILVRAADEALARGTPTLAVTLLERAQDEGAATAVLAPLGRARLAAGDPAASANLVQALASAATPGERLQLAGATAQAQFVAGDLPAALATIRAGMAEADALGDRSASRALLVIYATLSFDDVRARTEIVRRVEIDGDRTPQLRAVAAMDGLMVGRPARDVVQWATQAVDGLPADAGIDIASTYHLALFALAGCDAVDAADAAVERTLLAARDHGSRFGLGLACFFRAWVRWRRGDLPGALADVEQTLEFAEQGGGFTIPNIRWIEAECALLQGRPDDAAASIEIGMAAAREIGWGMTGAWLLGGRAALALRRGAYEQALADALESGETFAEVGAPSPAMADWRGRAVDAALALGDHDRAVALAHDALRTAQTVGTATVLAAAYRCHAQTLAPEDRPARLAEAAAVAATGPNVLLRAEILLELGRALRHRHQRVAAREPLQQALDLARRCRASALADAARIELDATGAVRREEPAWGLEALTAREHELARMAASGLSNPEIAARLFITRKTVESHLSAVFRKLELASRDQLDDALRGGLGVAP